MVQERTNPRASNGRARSSRCSTMNRNTASNPSAPIGTLRKKIQRHDAYVVMKPPSGGPRTGAISPGVVMNAIARSKSALAVLRSTTSRPTGTIIAPPIPCTMRANVNSGRFCASPQSTDESVNRTIALAKIVREPKRSATQPLTGMKTASVSK